MLNSKVLKQIEELVDFYYRKFNVTLPKEDIYQDVIVRIIVTKYMERYDNVRPLRVYLSGFIFMILLLIDI